MIIRITYEQGNGYQCGCCRRTNIQTHDCHSEEEAIEWLSELQASKTISDYEDEWDRDVESIAIIQEDDVDLTFNQELVDKIIKQRTAKKKRKEAYDEKSKAERKIKDDKKKLAELKQKYEDETNE